jgi:dGTPase
VRVYEVLEDLNLSWEVRDGIRAHTWKITPPPVTLEAITVRYADRIAYLTHDALDAQRAGVLVQDDFPPHLLERLGPPGRRWVGELITAVVDESLRSGEVRMDAETLGLMHELRDFMFERVYLRPAQTAQQEEAVALLRRLMDHHLAHPDDMPATYRDTDAPLVTQVADYVSGMTDRYAQAADARLG